MWQQIDVNKYRLKVGNIYATLYQKRKKVDYVDIYVVDEKNKIETFIGHSLTKFGKDLDGAKKYVEDLVIHMIEHKILTGKGGTVKMMEEPICTGYSILKKKESK